MAISISLPPSSATLAALAQLTTPVTPVEVAITSTPPNINQLLRQIQITGTIASPPNENTVTLATALGNFSFSLSQLPQQIKQQLLQQLEILFQNQKPLTATLQPGSPPTQAVLILPSPSGSQAPAQTTAPQPLPNFPPAPPLSPGMAVPAIVLPPDIVVPGALLPEVPRPSAQIPVPQQTATPELPAPQSPETTSTAQPARPVNAPLPSANAQPAILPANTAPLPSASSAPIPIAQPLPETAPQNTPVATPQTIATPPVLTTTTQTPPATTGLPNSLLQPGKEVSLRIDAISLPSAPPLVSSQPNQIAATVIGNGPTGQLILKTPDTTLYIRTNTEAPVGTNLLITPEPPKDVALAILTAPGSQTFESLQETLTALTQINPQLAQQFASINLPQPGPHLAGPLLFFLSALKQGDMQGWLGAEATEALTKHGKLALINKLVRELASSTQMERDSSVGEWKSYPVPLHANGQFQTLTLHVHADGKGSSPDTPQGKATDQIRFLIDVRMSQFGAMQLDGLVRPKKLDMIVRSETALPPGLPQELRNSYTAAIDAMGFTGGLSFQTGRQHWLEPRRTTTHSLIT